MCYELPEGGKPMNTRHIILVVAVLFASLSFPFKSKSQPASQGLVAYYPFNGNANDESGNGNHATVHGATLAADRHGNLNRAYNFDGTDDFLEIPHNSSLQPTTQFSVCAWVHPNGFYSGRCQGNEIVSKGANDDDPGAYTLRFGDLDNDCDIFAPNKHFGLGINFSGSARRGVESTTVISLHRWYFVVGTYDGSVMKLFVNGLLEDNLAVSETFANNSSDITIGKHQNPSFPYLVNGIIDDICLYNRALTDDEIVDLFGNGGRVAIDIKPQSCPNSLNTKSKGRLPVAILGTSDFDVNDVDVSTVQLEGVSPLRSNIKDVSTPVVDPQDECDCTTDGAYGFDDLSLKFDTQDIVTALGPVNDGDQIVLTLTGNLNDGTAIEGQDCIIIKSSRENAIEVIAQAQRSLPENHALLQNYPNPFNPSTTIEYALPQRAMVEIKVHDVLGREVATLLNEEKPAGAYTVRWNADGVASGVYFYRLQAGDFVDTKKLLLLK
jgi:hypothetical protein